MLIINDYIYNFDFDFDFVAQAREYSMKMTSHSLVNPLTRWMRTVK